jgi:ribosome-associated protein
MNTAADRLHGRALADRIVALAIEKKAEKIVLLNLSQETGIADYFVICEGDNPMHTRAIADEIIDGLREEHKIKAWHVEGKEDGRWVLVDFSDVVVHVMLPEVRDYYQIENLWGTVERIEGTFSDS